jgi:hypothetical protein
MGWMLLQLRFNQLLRARLGADPQPYYKENMQTSALQWPVLALELVYQTPGKLVVVTVRKIIV